MVFKPSRRSGGAFEGPGGCGTSDSTESSARVEGKDKRGKKPESDAEIKRTRAGLIRIR